MKENRFWHEFLRYLVVGSFNTLLGFALILTFQSIFYLNPYTSNALSFLCCHLISFKIHKNYTFKTRSSPDALWKFSSVILLSWLVNILALSLLLSLGADGYISQGFAMICYVITSFTLHRLFTFA